MTDRHTDRHTHRQTDRQTDKPIDVGEKHNTFFQRYNEPYILVGLNYKIEKELFHLKEV